MSTARRVIERANLGVYVQLSLIATLEIAAGPLGLAVKLIEHSGS